MKPIQPNLRVDNTDENRVALRRETDRGNLTRHL